MRIRYFADVRFPIERANGVQTMETCQALAGLGHHVDLVVRPDTHHPARDPFAYYGLPRTGLLTITPVAVPAGPSARRVAYLAHALRLGIGADDADVLFTRDLALAAWFLRCPPRCRPPVVYESHGYAPAVSGNLPALISGAAMPSARKARRLATRESRVWHRADGYVTITDGLRAELEDRFGRRERLAVVPDGARVPSERPPRPVRTGRRPVVGYAGHLYPWKGVDVLLHALARLPDVEALVVGGLPGEPDLERVRALAARVAPGRVALKGYVPPTQVASCLAVADVLVVPNTPSRLSATYTSPLKLFEYMASGRPIVASDLPSLREVLADGDTAVLAEAGNAEALATAIARVLDDDTFAERLAVRAFDAVRGFSWERRAARIDELLQAVLAVCHPHADDPRRTV